tara:strand:+ start:146 stop:307 length:162 start_codon:yes stop_codon:yes gene_type:complete
MKIQILANKRSCQSKFSLNHKKKENKKNNTRVISSADRKANLYDFLNSIAIIE